MGTLADADWTRYVDARWPDLVGGLEDEGVPADAARLAVSEVLLAWRRSWARRDREEPVDVSVWAAARDRAGLAAQPGAPAPHGVRPFDPHDAPEPWLARAGRVRVAQRRRRARLGAGWVAVGAVLASGWLWWAALPQPPQVREEANPLPVVWYAQGELHLDAVVVELPGVEEFVAWGSGAAARLRSGELVHVTADGEVDDLDEPPAILDEAPQAPPFAALGDYDVLVQSAPVPGGGWAHLLDSSRRSGGSDAVRQSESGRRALVVCTADLRCGPPETVTQAEGSIRLR